MLSLFICALPVQAPIRSTDLHPDEAIVVVEVPDVPAMLDAYSGAPLVTLLRDEALTSAVEAIFDDLAPDFDLNREVGSALARLGCPEELTERPFESALAAARSVHELSISVSLEPGGGERLARELANWQEALGELAELQTTLEQAKRTTGLPSSLETLLVDERLHTDPWGNAYVYRPDSNGSFFTLFSRGADGEDGGSGAASDFAPYTSLEKMLVDEAWSLAGILAVARLDGAERSANATSALQHLAGRAGFSMGERIDVRFGDDVGELRFLELPSAGDLPCWTMHVGPWLAIGLGRGGGGLVEQRLNDNTAPSARAFFEKHQSWLPEPNGATIVQASYRPRMALELLRDISAVTAGDEEAAFDVMVASAGEGGAMRMELVGDRFQTRFITREPSELPEMACCIARAPLLPEELAIVPDDAIGIFATTWEPELTAKVLLETMAEQRDSTGRSAAQRLAALEARHQFSLSEDFFGNLGNSVVAYLHPLRGLLSVPGLVLAVELEDPVAFRGALESVLGLLAESAGEEFEISTRDYRKTPMWSFDFGGGGGLGSLNFSLSPTLSIVGNHLLLTLTSPRAKKEIKRLVGGVDPTREYIAEAYCPPGDATIYGYFAWAELISGVYTGALSLLPLLGDQVPFDAALLPTADVLTGSFRPTYFWGRATGGISESYNESSFGPETWLGLLGTGFGYFWLRPSLMARESDVPGTAGAGSGGR